MCFLQLKYTLNMTKKDVAVVVLKVIIYICTLALGLLGAHAMVSCSSPTPALSQKGTVIINDTIYIR